MVLEENKIGGLTLPEFETYGKDTLIKTVWLWCKEQVNGTEQKFYSYINTL